MILGLERSYSGQGTYFANSQPGFNSRYYIGSLCLPRVTPELNVRDLSITLQEKTKKNYFLFLAPHLQTIAVKKLLPKHHQVWSANTHSLKPKELFSLSWFLGHNTAVLLALC